MFRGRRFVLMLMRRWTAPTRPVCHRERAQCHRTEQSYPAVQSVAAWSEPLTSSEEGKPEEDASCCDPDKVAAKRQEGSDSDVGGQSLARSHAMYRPIFLSLNINRLLGSGSSRK